MQWPLNDRFSSLPLARPYCLTLLLAVQASQHCVPVLHLQFCVTILWSLYEGPGRRLPRSVANTCRAARRVTASAGFAGRRPGPSRLAANVPAQPTADTGSIRGQTPWCAPCHSCSSAVPLTRSLVPHTLATTCSAQAREPSDDVLREVKLSVPHMRPSVA